MLITNDMVKEFKDPKIVNDTLKIILVNSRGEKEEGDDFGGVFRDALSSFWAEFLKGHAIGESEMAPCIRHDFSMQDWQSVGRILVKGYKDSMYFSLSLSKSFIIVAFFGEHVLPREKLMEGFFRYIPFADATVLKKTINQKSLTEEDKNDVIDILSTLSSRRTFHANVELKSLLTEIAHKEIVQAPSYIKETWRYVYNRSEISKDPIEVSDYYNSATPTAKKILQLLEVECQNDREKEILYYLKKVIRGISNGDLSKFLRYVTGADVICVDKITMGFNELDGAERRVIAHTCGPLLELPTTYDCYFKFKEEFLNLLQSGYWCMDIA